MYLQSTAPVFTSTAPKTRSRSMIERSTTAILEIDTTSFFHGPYLTPDQPELAFAALSSPQRQLNFDPMSGLPAVCPGWALAAQSFFSRIKLLYNA
jgi:hypothetical protein